jgi:lipoyl-dependent peroxiredoxin
MIRKAKAVWRGTGRAGSGHLSTDSGVLAETPYSFKTRFENEKGTNPEELIAAAHASCFTMALAFGLQAGGFTPTELTTEAAVTLEPEGQGFRISSSALTLRAKVPNLDQSKFAEMAKDAEKNARSQRFSTPRSRWTPSWSEASRSSVSRRITRPGGRSPRRAGAANCRG